MSIYFYLEREHPYGCFSNFSLHGFELDGNYWLTSEHYFQAQKFIGTVYAEQVRAASTPKQAAEIGRERSNPLRPDWEQVKDDVMYRAVLKKFQTHGNIGSILVSTGNEDIVENSPTDYYWGCGKSGTGQNKLGIVLMDVRTLLRATVQEP